MESHAQELVLSALHFRASVWANWAASPRDSHLIGYFNYQAEQSCDRKKQLVPVPQTLTCKFAVSECAETRRQVTERAHVSRLLAVVPSLHAAYQLTDSRNLEKIQHIYCLSLIIVNKY